MKLRLDISKDFYREEERDGFFISSTMKRVWAVELDLLAKLMDVCAKNNILFWADAGTILGAVRHKGFIPWDDDIDIIMLRKDYDKLCKIASKEFTHPYFFQTEKTDRGSLRGHAQLRNTETTAILEVEKNYKYKFNQGIFTDIFPLDNLFKNEIDLDKQCKEISLLRKKYIRYSHWTKERYVTPNSLIKKILKGLAFYLINPFVKAFFDPHKIYKKYEEELSKCKDESSEKVAKLALGNFEKRRIWKRENLKEAIYMPFEMLKIPLPCGYINILNTFYGDWQNYKIATSTHGKVFFDTERTYKYYIYEK